MSTLDDPVPDDARSALVRPRAGVLRWWGGVGSALVATGDWCLGVLALVILGAAMAVVPVAQFVVLGYLQAAGGRVGRSGRLRDALLGVRAASRLGRAAFLVGVGLLPARLVADLAASAEAIDPGGPIARRWHAAALVVGGLAAGHLTLACVRGGRLGHFLWPPGQARWLAGRVKDGAGRSYTEARDAACTVLARLDLPGLLRTGALGYAGTQAWLAVPVALLILGRRAPVLGFAGGITLGLIAAALPFLQVHMAAEGRFGALFEVRAVRERFRRAPLAFAASFLLLILAAGPLYLFRIESVPREVAGLEGVAFLVALAPARVGCGWAYARGGRREAPRAWWARGAGGLGMLASAAAYVAVVVLTQYTSWDGIWGLADQHAFLLPTPTFGR